MPYFDSLSQPPDHLRHIFANIESVFVSRGELENLRALEREVDALKHDIGEHPLETVVVHGTVLKTLLALV